MDRDKLLQAAQKLVEKKRYDKAIIEYQKAVAIDPEDARTLLKIGDLHLKLAQFPQAIEMYERVGAYYSRQGFHLKAIAVYKQIREIVRKHVPHLEDRFGHIVPKLAELYTHLGLTSDALAAYDEVATRFQRAGRDRDAIDIFRKVVDLDPQNPLPYLRLAEAFVRVRDLDNAIERFASAANILLKLGRKDDALKVVERLLMHRADAKFARQAAEIYLERAGPNDGMAALTKLQICFKEDPKNLETLGLLARTFDVLGQPAKAVEVHKEAARIAKEAGAREQCQELLAILAQRAPHDPAVAQLQQELMSIPPPGRAAPSMPDGGLLGAEPASSMPGSSLTVDSSEIEEVDELDLVEDDLEEEPFALDRQSQVDLGSSPVGPGERVSEADLLAPPQARPSAPERRAPSLPQSPQDRLRALLAQAEAHRRARQYDAAIAVLRNALPSLPSARELRERLCDLLIESGDQDGATEEMMAFASHLHGQGDGEGAARLLDEVLLLEPEHQGAKALLRDMGYAVPESMAPSQEYVVEYGGEPVYQEPGYDPNAPLPSYDLEEVSPSDVMSKRPATPGPNLPRAAPPPPRPMPIGGVEADAYAADAYAGDAYAGDAYGGDGYADGRASAPPLSVAPSSAPISAPPTSSAPGPGSVAPISAPPVSGPALAGDVRHSVHDEPTRIADPLPSFPIDEMQTGEGDLTGPPSAGDVSYDAAAHSDSTPGDRVSDPGDRLDEEALEEIDFFAANQMFTEAKNLLREQLLKLPNHPLLLEKERDLDQQMLEAQAAQAHGAAPETADPEDRSFDIAASLDALDALEAPAASAGGAPTQDVSVETVFEQFKAGVAAQISESDAATHYDLGVAYQEMGLIPDAIGEFELASRDPSRECVCQSMIGSLHMRAGNIDAAIDAFLRGLHAPHRTVDQELALRYEIGDCYEQRENTEQARYYFQLVERQDPSYRDPRGSVQERITRLSPQPQAPAAKAAGAEADEFDAAFDELFEEGKLP